MSESEMNELDDMPKGGPLAEYRARASFNWKKLALFFEEIDLIRYKVQFFYFLLLGFF